MASKFEKRDIEYMIKSGQVDNFRDAVEAGLIKIPDDLINLNYRGDSAFHVAARNGQVEMIQFLATGLKIKKGENETIWGFDAKIKNKDNDTALDIAKRYGNRVNKLSSKRNRPTNQAMMRFLQTAEMEPGLARDQALRMMEEERIVDAMPKKKENLTIPQKSMHAYGGHDEQGNLKSDDILYQRIKKEIEEERKQKNAARAAREEAKQEFFSKVRNGVLTESDVKEFVKGGGRLDCREGRGGDNALDLAIIRGHDKIVKMLVEGVECETKSGKKITPRLEIDEGSKELLDRALKINPKSVGHQKIKEELNKPAVVVGDPRGVTLERYSKIRPTSAEVSHGGAVASH